RRRPSLMTSPTGPGTAGNPRRWHTHRGLGTNLLPLPRLAHAQKRGGGRVRGDSALAGFDGLADSGPTPDVAAQLAEELPRLRHGWDDPADPDLRRIAVGKMEGDANADIARKLGCSVPTVERRLRLIRTLLQQA